MIIGMMFKYVVVNYTNMLDIMIYFFMLPMVLGKIWIIMIIIEMYYE